jgi:hypothetical protein
MMIPIMIIKMEYSSPWQIPQNKILLCNIILIRRYKTIQQIIKQKIPIMIMIIAQTSIPH